MGFKSKIRHLIARLFGLGVEAGSMLGGTAGPLADAERDMAEQETEEAIDAIDGEG